MGLQIATSSRFLVNNGLYPKETSVSTGYRVLPRLRLGLFTITSSPKEPCRVCSATASIRFHTSHVSSQSSLFIIYNKYSHANHIHSYIHKIIAFIH